MWQRVTLAAPIFGASRTLADVRRAWGYGAHDPVCLRVGGELMRVRRIIDSFSCWVERGWPVTP